MTRFRRKPDLRFYKPRSIRPEGLKSFQHPAGDRGDLPRGQVYADPSIPLPVEDVKQVTAEDESFIRIFGAIAKMKKVQQIADAINQQVYIPVPASARRVRQAVRRRDLDELNGARISFELFKEALNRAVHEYDFVNFEFLDNIQNDPDMDSELFRNNWALHNVDELREANDALNAGEQGIPGSEVLTEDEIRNSAPWWMKLLVYGGSIILIWYLQKQLGIYQGIDTASATSTKLPPGTDIAPIILNIVVGIAIYLLLNSLTLEEAKTVFAHIQFPGLNITNDELVEMADRLVRGEKVNGKTLEEYPIGVSKEFLRLAKVKLGEGDWEVIKEFSIRYLMNNIENDDYFPWHMHLDSSVHLYQLEKIGQTAPKYSPLFKRHAKKHNIEISHSGGVFQGPKSEPRQPVSQASFEGDVYSERYMKETKRSFLDSPVPESQEEWEALGSDIGSSVVSGSASSIWEAIEKAKKAKNEGESATRAFGESLSGSFAGAEAMERTTSYLHQLAGSPAIDSGETLKARQEELDFWDTLATIASNTADDLLALLISDRFLKRTICCFLRVLITVDLQHLKAIHALLDMLASGLKLDLGSAIEKLYKKFFTDLIDQLLVELHAVLDEMWQKFIEKHLEHWMDVVEEIDAKNECFMLSLFMKIIYSAIGQVKSKIDELIDKFVNSLKIKADLSWLKIQLWAEIKPVKLFLDIIGSIVQFIESCDQLSETEIRQLENKIQEQFQQDTVFTDPVAQLNAPLFEGVLPVGDSLPADVQSPSSTGGDTGTTAQGSSQLPFLKIEAFGQEVELPNGYNTATSYNSWNFAEAKEFGSGFILVPFHAILEGQRVLDDDAASVEQTNKCRDRWSLAIIAEIMKRVNTENLAAMSLIKMLEEKSRG